MEWYFYPALLLVGLLAGFINTLAGSGSLLVLPMLMYAGLPATVANGTNRIGILFQSIVAVFSFKKQGILHFNQLRIFFIPSVLGAIVGAVLASSLSARGMEMAIGVMLFIMVLTMFFNSEAWIKEHSGTTKALHPVVQMLMYFAIGIYGGFIQAGVGLFLLAALVLGSGKNLVEANAIKLVIVLIFTPFALVVYIYNQQIHLLAGILVALGSMTGAYLASKYAKKLGVKFLKNFLIIIVLLTAADLLGVFDLILSVF